MVNTANAQRDMPEPHAGGALHLPDLVVEGFCGIRKLKVKRLGRVTLIAGANGSGKSTLLDAISMYANRGDLGRIRAVLDRRKEHSSYTDSDGDKVLGIRWASLFFGRTITPSSVISVGVANQERRLNMTVRVLSGGEIREIVKFTERSIDPESRALVVRYQAAEHHIAMIPDRSFGMANRILARDESNGMSEAAAITCDTFGPALPTSDQLASYWGDVVLTPDESRAVTALNLVCGDGVGVERIAVIPSDTYRHSRVLVQLEGERQPVPLHSLGDGAVRVFGIALALAACSGGFLLIDEVENGIHHTVHHDFWRMVLQTAHANNVQVLATTHGWDAVVGFAQAAAELDKIDAALVRLERDGNETFAVEYSEEDLAVVADQGIEVR